MRVPVSAVCAAVLIAIPAFAQTMSGSGLANPPITGIVQSFDGGVLAIKAADGHVAAAKLTPDTIIYFNAKRTLADIKPGDFIASGGTMGPDGKLRANEIRIFSAVRSEGQFPMSQPNQMMTNATVEKVMTNATVQQVGSASGVPVIKLSFHGAGAPGTANCTGRSSDAVGGAGTGCVGKTEFEVPADVPIVAQLPGNVSMLKVGVKASMNVTKVEGGAWSAVRITILEQQMQ
ncbi:MAG TPA: hypothetical protein VK779_00175 [Rhizomicrobium sp.]|jgi:hypothetical protein|nr:hypothetical protein [Rhizomicrobium sp.]